MQCREVRAWVIGGREGRGLGDEGEDCGAVGLALGERGERGGGCEEEVGAGAVVGFDAGGGGSGGGGRGCHCGISGCDLLGHRVLVCRRKRVGWEVVVVV